MKITSSYGIEIKNINKMLITTANIYQDALSFCITTFENEWQNIEPLDTLSRNNYGEHLIHNTKDNVAKYQDFDTKFYKMPSYMRRDIVSTAIGHLSSYHSNYKNWEDNGKKGNAPTLQTHLRKFPTFYKGNMSDISDIDNDTIRIKLFVGNDWKFVTVRLKHTDMQYIRKNFCDKKISNPTLEKKYKKWFLRFAITEETKLHNKSIQEQRVLAIDLGINTDATCSVMLSDGTILARKFINFASDKDRIWHCLNKIKKIQKHYGNRGGNTRKLWRYCKALNDELARKIAKSITDYALEMQVDTIVFEYLDTKGKKRGFKKQRLTMWKKNTIQNIVEHKAHRNSMRISHICAWNTSKLAFDGSGVVLRGKDANLNTYELCKFSNGKIYNCDLSASYNIGARYFIREILKSSSAKKRSDIEAKVPVCQKRTLCTYATLLEINRVV